MENNGNNNRFADWQQTTAEFLLKKETTILLIFIQNVTHENISYFYTATFISSFLSAFLANTSPMKYSPNMAHTVASTTKLPLSAKLPNSAHTLSKSMGFGATRKSPPNADKWVQRQ